MSAPHFITDDKGVKLSVILSIEDYERMLEELDDQEDVRLYDEAMAEGGEAIPFDEAIKLIESNRNKQ